MKIQSYLIMEKINCRKDQVRGEKWQKALWQAIMNH
jgi:hypothetical protein